MSVTTAETFTKNPATATAEIDGQLVALDIQAGVCFGLNAVATAIWKLLDEEHDVPRLADRLQDLYEVDRATCEQETRMLLDELADVGLISRD